jgi:hypothetical protein
VKEGAAPPRVNAPCRPQYSKLLNEFLTLYLSTAYRLRQRFAASVLSFPLRTAEILTRTQPMLGEGKLGWG